MILTQGDTVGGKYRIRHLLGEGGMAVVYLATELATGRSVALKVMREHLRLHEQSVQRFVQEARAASKVQHPGVVQVYELGQEPTYYWLTMELLRGESLESRLDRGPLTLGELELVFVGLLEILKQVHAVGIVHRDLKPANVFLETLPSGRIRIRLLDFGIAKLTDSSLGAFATQVGSALGTPGYMAPEQTMQAATVDARADIYALGALLYECLSNRLPFQATTLAELVGKQLSERPSPIAVADNLRGYARTALICLAVDIKQRPRNTDEVLRLLRQPPTLPKLDKQLPTTPPVFLRSRDAQSGQARGRRLSLYVWPAAAAALTLAIWFLVDGDESGPPEISVAEAAIVPVESSVTTREPYLPEVTQVEDPKPIILPARAGTPSVTPMRTRSAPQVSSLRSAAKTTQLVEQPAPDTDPSAARAPEHARTHAPTDANLVATNDAEPQPRVWGRDVQDVALPLSAQQFTTVVNANQRALQSCYEGASRFVTTERERELARSIDVSVNVVVDASGATRSVSVLGDQLGDMQACMRSTIKRWRFPRSAGDSSFDFPLRFSSDL